MATSHGESSTVIGYLRYLYRLYLMGVMVSVPVPPYCTVSGAPGTRVDGIIEKIRFVQFNNG
jgi:hypothetical protein